MAPGGSRGGPDGRRRGGGARRAERHSRADSRFARRGGTPGGDRVRLMGRGRPSPRDDNGRDGLTRYVYETADRSLALRSGRCRAPERESVFAVELERGVEDADGVFGAGAGDD